jgi:hypothetical protein
VEVLPLTVVNLLQNVSSEALKCDAAITLENASSETLAVDLGKVSLCDPVVTKQMNALMSDLNTDADDDSEGGLQLVEPIDDKSEFGNTELEDLVLKEGPQQIVATLTWPSVGVKPNTWKSWGFGVVATLTWPSVGGKPNTWKSWGFGVLQDSRTFRARQQDPKHLALGCSWCHWKGLEA